jgi:aspartyl-tRNA(Asn)/glutamyl-tRNA(Gln) amidotransferase subunit B
MPSAANFAKLISMNVAGDLNSRGTKDILAMILATDTDPEALANQHGLIQKNDPEALRSIVQACIDTNPSVVAQYRETGKEQLLMFFVGQVMKESKGSANPGITLEIVKDILK